MKKQRVLTGILTSMLIFSISSVVAVMPPFFEAQAALNRIVEYKDLRLNATSVMTVDVTKTQVDRTEANQCPSIEDWEIEAIVRTSIRGEITPGSKIRIRYERSIYRCPGPIRDELPVLAVGQTLDAYLSCHADLMCVPAARAMSFADEASFQSLLAQRNEDFEKENAKKRGPTPPPADLIAETSIYFRRSSLELLPAEQQLLLRHAEYLKREPKVRIRLISYTEPSMSRESALVISEKRALIVEEYLIRAGVIASNIDILPVGLEKTPPPPTLSHKKNIGVQGVVVLDYQL